MAGWDRKKYPLQSNILDGSGNPVIETVELWKRNPMKLIKELLENPKWKDKMRYKPHMMFADKECTERIFNEQWTCDWLIEKYVRDSFTSK